MFALELIFLSTLYFSCYVKGSYFDDAISKETQCQCVPPHLCADNDDAANGQGLLDIRFEDNSCDNHFEVCCDMPISSPSSLAMKKCGISNAGGIGPRITSNSEKTAVGEHPWTVLVFDSSTPTSSLCGGSLIHPQVILTAAHCVDTVEKESLKVRAGEWNLRSDKEPLHHQDESVKEVLVHPQYRAETLWNDIALLVLEKAFADNENVGFICLAPLTKENIDVEECVVSGWGSKAMGKKKLSAVLRKVTLPLVGRGRCQKALRGTRLGKWFRLHKSFMCAGGEKNRDACRGDGGSPLICPVVREKERYVQLGIVSWGIGCGASKTPGVYINVEMFGGWIEEQMKAKNFSTSFYNM